MNNAEIQKSWLDAHRRLEEEAERLRNSQLVSFGLLELYDGLAAPEKACVHSILEEWLVSDDNKKRYDARFIISLRKIRPLKAAVERAVAKFVGQTGPEARFEVEDLRKMARELS